MYFLRLIIPLLIFSLSCAAQDYTEYSSFKYSQRDVIYSTHFEKLDSVNSAWLQYCGMTNETEKSIGNSLLTIKTHFSLRSDSANYTSFFLPFEYNKNFEVEFRARLDKEKAFKRYGVLRWGLDSNYDNVNGQRFLFHSNGCYSMGYESGADSNVFDIERHRCVYMPHGSFITYTIRKVNNVYYVFVNQKYSHSYTYTPLHGQYLLLTVSGATTLEMDYIIISYLKSQ